MSKDKTTFSLFDFCKKKADKVQIYGEETLHRRKAFLTCGMSL